MNRIEAGRRGGLATFRKYGSQHMSRIGKAGFAALREKYAFCCDYAVLLFLHQEGAKCLMFSPDRHNAATCPQCGGERYQIDDRALPANSYNEFTLAEDW